MRTVPCFLSLLLVGCAHTAPVTARSEDVSSIDGLMKAFYEVVNLPPGAPRQWARDRTLYAPWIHFVSSGTTLEVFDHAAFVAATDPLIDAGFREREINRVVRRYGNVAHVESTYETRSGPSETLTRGVNFLELYFDGTRWWVASAVWQSESAELPIPPTLLSAEPG
jgi:hypothetical protein